MWSIYSEVWKIVRNSMNYMQVVAYSLSSFIGIFVLFFALHCYLDFVNYVKHDLQIFKKDFIIVSKKVSVLQAITNNPAQFSKREVENIAKQNFVRTVDEFQSSLFQIKLFTESSKIPPIHTDLFFESVPDSYLNIESKDWKWETGQTFIPIILPQNFLSLYNYGFAPSQGLPQLSQSLFSKIPLKIRIRGNGLEHEYSARIVDFSSRIQTILVPNSFLQWANLVYASPQDTKPSKILIDCYNIADSHIYEYLTKQNFEIQDDSLVHSKLAFYLKLTLTIVAGVGVLITLLAVWLLLFSFQLIIEKNKYRIQNLYYLGYSLKQIQAPYNILSGVITVVLVLLSLLVSLYVHSFVVQQLQVLVAIESSMILIPILVAIGVLVGIVSLQYIFIKRTVYQAVA